jgi:hypothetical protein
VRQANAKAKIMFVNGINGQGTFELSRLVMQTKETTSIHDEKLRFSMPAALCSYCLGETRIGSEYQVGNLKKIEF